MMFKYYKFLLKIFIFFYSCSVIADNPNNVYELPPVIVTGTKIPKGYTPYNVVIISSEEIEKKKFTSIDEVLNYYLDVRARSPAQQDLSMRGATFEQVLILIDSIPIIDPQTGHHNMDIPISLSDIERIEILKGGISSIYGSAAFGGVVNIITKKRLQRENLKIIYGENNTSNINLTIPIKVNNIESVLTTDEKESDGFYYNTDYRIKNLSVRSKFNNSIVNFHYLDKSFGANNFYGLFPSYEKTETILFTLTKELDNNSEAKFYYRAHYDEFILRRYNPSSYVNYHKKYLYGFNVYSPIYSNKTQKVILGVSAEKNRIKSTGIRQGKPTIALGFHTKGEISPYLETEYTRNNFTINSSLRYYNLYRLIPTIVSLYKNYSVIYRAKYSKAFRSPSYTELYYKDPGNIGNPTLDEEKSTEYELGIDYNNKFHLTLFRREAYDLIDWVKKRKEEPWQAKNITEIDFTGIEAIINISPFRLDYTFLTADKKLKEYISKYVLTYPKHSLSVFFDYNLSKLYNNLRVIYKKKATDESYFILNSSHSIKYKNNEIFIKLNNIGDKKYYEIENIRMPPRYIEVGIDIKP